MNLSTQQLEYLVAVAGGGTWADAAARLGISQSALSQGLGQLERRLGLPLFQREGRRRVLLGSAAPVVDYARRVVAETRDLGRWANAAAHGEAGVLRIGMIDLAATVLFGETLQRYRRRHPAVDVHLAVVGSAALAELLRAGELSMAVIVEPPLNTGEFELTPLLDDELAVYGPDGDEAPVGAWGPWVTFPADSHTRHLVARSLARLGASFDVIAESHQPEVLRGMVALGMGWTVLPVAQAETVPNPLVRASPEPLLERRLVAATRRAAVADPLAAGLLVDLRRTARALGRR